MTDDNDFLDKPGEWEIRADVYLNGRPVAFCDSGVWDTYEDAAYWLGEGFSTREVDMHTPLTRKSRR